MTEQVSALMDDQLDGEECDGCLRRLKDDAGLRERWETYHLIGDALRGTPGRGLPASFAARLAAEPTVLAPRRAPAAVPQPRRTALYALSAAASVVAVTAVAWVALPLVQPPAPPIATITPPPVIAEAPPAPAPALVPVAQGVADYMLAHQRYSPRAAMTGAVTYVRSVAEDAGRR